MSDAAAASPRTAKPARARTLACPHCGGTVGIRASGITITAVCASCGSVLDVANDDVRLIAAAAQRTRTPLIAIGTRGTLDGTEWEVIGYQQRSSEGGSWQWEEYLLFNPYQGFRFLAQDHGHWTLYVVLRQSVSPDGVISGDPTQYRLDTDSPATTEYVLGEFYWRVKAGDTVAVREFVAPPNFLSEERDGTEVTWSRGTFVAPVLVQNAFRPRTMPKVEGKADNQPVPPARSLGRLWAVAGVSVALTILTQLAPLGPDRNRLLIQQPFVVAHADQGRSLASPLFDIPDRGGNLTFEVTAPAHGDWVDVQLALVAAVGDRRFDIPVAVDVSVGPANTSVTLPDVPGGSYKLLATMSAPSSFDSFGFLPTPAHPADPNAPTQFTVAVRRHTPTAGYFFIACALILAWPAVVTIWRYYRNQAET